MREKVDVLGVGVDALTVGELHAEIERMVRGGDHALILHANPHLLNLSYCNPWLRGFLNRASIVFCDGVGVMLGAWILGRHLPEKIPYTDWIWQSAEFAEPRGFTFFFLGASPGVADKAAARLRERFPKLRIVGVHHGYFDKTPGSPENEAVIRKINAARPNLLLVAFGMPLQERWLMENWERIEVNVGLTGGAVLDYTSGEMRRGPRLLTDNGLEWLARLIIEPRRLWKRSVIGSPLFLLRVLRQRLGRLRLES